MTPDQKRNEHRKHIASWCNTAATAIIAAGTFVPMANYFLELFPHPVDDRKLFLVASGCLLVGYVLHLWGHYLIGGLE